MYIVVSNAKFACNMAMLNIHTFRLSLLFGGLDPIGIFLSTRFGRKLLLISYKVRNDFSKSTYFFLIADGKPVFCFSEKQVPRLPSCNDLPLIVFLSPLMQG